jgi:hypothetical protein
MNAAAIVAELSAMGVSVVIAPPDRIRLTVQAGDLPAEAVALARDRKPALIEHLRPNCRPHNNPANYIDKAAPNRPGWIRTTCRVCGRFIGYRRDDAFR